MSITTNGERLQTVRAALRSLRITVHQHVASDDQMLQGEDKLCVPGVQEHTLRSSHFQASKASLYLVRGHTVLLRECLKFLRGLDAEERMCCREKQAGEFSRQVIHEDSTHFLIVAFNSDSGLTASRADISHQLWECPSGIKLALGNNSRIAQLLKERLVRDSCHTKRLRLAGNSGFRLGASSSEC